MADPTTWKDVGIELAKVLPGSIIAAGTAVGFVYREMTKMRKDAAEDRRKRDKKLQEIQVKQIQIEKKADGNHQIALKAIRQQGRYEGHKEARREVKEDLVDAVKTVKTAAKRGQRRTDK